MGQRPKPAAIKRLEGNPGKRRINEGPSFTKTTMKAPSHLNSSAKKEWNRVVKELASLDMLRGVDTANLAAYCQSYARWAEAELILEKEGVVVYEPIVNRAGDLVGHKIKKHPAVNISQVNVAVMLRSSALFGFNPSDRTRIQLPDTKQVKDPFEEFMMGMGADMTHDETEV